MKTRFYLATALVLGAIWSCRAQMSAPLSPTIEPSRDTVSTSTREVRALCVAPDGAVWVATSGGVLRFQDGKWRKWTRQSGLPAHEAVSWEAGAARFPIHRAKFDGSWHAQSAPPYERGLQTVWRGQKVTDNWEGMGWNGRVVHFPLMSRGTHISAFEGSQKLLLVAFYGDGLWNFDGKTWSRGAAVPEAAREITALARDADSLWLGTRRDGVFRLRAGKWTPMLQPDEPFSHNIQFFGEFRGVLWASTLDDGLIYRSGASWNHVSAPQLSSSAPRQMVEFQDQLFVRHGGGLVDSFDGRNWTKNALASIPRRGVYALAANEKTLFAAGWGGWSEWDGATWTPHFDLPELKGVPLMGLFLDGQNLWIATQSRGLGLYRRGAKTFRWFDERDGMPDDWVTATAKFGGKIYAGTFVGGLARLDGEKWHVFPAMRGENVTALAESGGKLMVATRTGVWEVQGDSAVRVEKPWLDSEVQALHAGKTGLWVGARTSLNWLKLKTGEEAG